MAPKKKVETKEDKKDGAPVAEIKEDKSKKDKVEEKKVEEKKKEEKKEEKIEEKKQTGEDNKEEKKEEKKKPKKVTKTSNIIIGKIDAQNVLPEKRRRNKISYDYEEEEEYFPSKRRKFDKKNEPEKEVFRKILYEKKKKN
jgi:hypothetical protein